jgi:hypothetical protein
MPRGPSFAPLHFNPLLPTGGEGRVRGVQDFHGIEKCASCQIPVVNFLSFPEPFSVIMKSMVIGRKKKARERKNP